jgi:hypothetical protein
MPVDSERRRRRRGARWFCQRASRVLAATQSRGRRGEEGLKAAVHAEGGVVEAAALDYDGRAPVVLIGGSVVLEHRRTERSEVAATNWGKVECGRIPL